MFSDLVGSTALSARMYPEDLREVIAAYQKCVAETVKRFGGFVAKYMGDGVLVYFGYPQAHEDDPERAVRAGLELIRAVGGLKSRTSLQTRVGIATGLVVVGDLIGSGAAQEQAVVGETPNLAARLQSIAEPNTVVISESTRKLLGNLFELEDLGSKDLKGISAPVRAWAVLRPASVESRFEALHVLAADVVGYSRLIGEDESGTVKSVREHREALRPIVRGLGGRLVKTMGDGVLLEFSSVIAAVECAIAIQKQMVERNIGVPEGKRILYRIGVNLGDVLIEGRDILGDGVNIAARLEGMAEPGGICISGSAYDQVRGRIDAEFVDLGERALKNIARPVRVYALRAVESVPSAAQSTPGEHSGPPRLSIVVGGGEEHDYFVDGITDSLTTDLSRILGAFVIRRNTAFTYKNKAVDLKQIGRELNVRYVLEGSVQRSGNQVKGIRI
jgi:class 3 adenylate cyclase